MCATNVIRRVGFSPVNQGTPVQTHTHAMCGLARTDTYPCHALSNRVCTGLIHSWTCAEPRRMTPGPFVVQHRLDQPDPHLDMYRAKPRNIPAPRVVHTRLDRRDPHLDMHRAKPRNVPAPRIVQPRLNRCDPHLDMHRAKPRNIPAPRVVQPRLDQPDPHLDIPRTRSGTHLHQERGNPGYTGPIHTQGHSVWSTCAPPGPRQLCGSSVLCTVPNPAQEIKTPLPL